MKQKEVARDWRLARDDNAGILLRLSIGVLLGMAAKPVFAFDYQASLGVPETDDRESVSGATCNDAHNPDNGILLPTRGIKAPTAAGTSGKTSLAPGRQAPATNPLRRAYMSRFTVIPHPQYSNWH